jgi:demethylmenaquinone methyltransferase / 2-methoxy-6-polyprenyl-1,4-benzoquinol methylase
LSTTITPYKDEQRTKKEQVAEMFDNIAPRYDLLNSVLSMGVHGRWRRKAIRMIGHTKPKLILDIATGTGDFAIAAMELRPDHVTGVDISAKMMEVGRAKIEKLQMQKLITLQLGDSEALEFPDNSFDAATVGFGVRNFGNLKKGLMEIHRVVKPGSMVAILEPSFPTSFPMKQLFGLYFKGILPLIGRLISKDRRAYSYLPESVKAFPQKKEFMNICREAGFTKVTYKPLSLGICALYLLEK